MRDTIFALSSGSVPSAIAVIRISGGMVEAVLQRMCCRKFLPRRATLTKISHPITGELLDQGLVLHFPGSSSVTGEDYAEFHVHGGRAVIQGISRALCKIECVRPAEPGEFMRRAFANGKLDLSTAEGIGDLIAADTEAQRRQAVTLSSGGGARQVAVWRDRLILANAQIAALIDFSDEGDVPKLLGGDFWDLISELITDIGGAIDAGSSGEIVNEGLTVVLAGPPNAGKSSLMNTLVRREIAIVTPLAGTTRDPIEVKLDVGGYPIVVVDTAGVRETNDLIEAEGVRRAIERVSRANVLVWMFECNSPTPPPPDIDLPECVLRVGTKCDVFQPCGEIDIALSVVSGVGVQFLLDQIRQFAEARLNSQTPVIFSHERQLSQLRRARDVLLGLSAEREIELLSEGLRAAGECLQRIVGSFDIESVLGEVFSRFCIGK